MDVDKLYSKGEVYPPREQIYRAIDLCPLNKTKVVIIGQDPYHGPGQANGLSFSVNKGIAIPPSLRNIYKELKSDLGIEPPNHGDLTSWAKQGILLLNAILTVEKGKPMSHAELGWENFTNDLLWLLNDNPKGHPIVFILWGKKAQEKKNFLDNTQHLIIQSNHPSPFSADKGFFGSKPFSRTNEFLIKNGIEPIDWRIE